MNTSVTVRTQSRNHSMPRLLLAAALVAALDVSAAPVAGDSYVYQVVNGYSREVRGQVDYRVDRADSSGITVSVTPEPPSVGAPRTEIYTAEGNWLRQGVESHGFKVDYVFATAYPAYVFPLAAGRTWSTRVNATVPGESRPRSVRVDGKVLGTERIRVPAGEFDAVKVERFVYPGDPNFQQTETRIVETDWYAPALGRPVRTERRSRWEEPSRCGLSGPCIFNGDWEVYELVSVRAAKK
jgi:hypothetical protein